jgi:hypothetical protein
MPREERFFELFVRHAQVTLAERKPSGVAERRRRVVRCCNEVNARENEADKSARRADGAGGRSSSR